MQGEHQPIQPADVPAREKTRTFPCPSCGADMQYDAKAGGLVCAYCGGKQDIDPGKAGDIEEHVNFDGEIAVRRWEGSKQIACETCGATWVLDAKIAAAQCPYCGASHVSETTGDMIMPDAVVPFQLDEKAAAERLKQWIRGRWFAPGAIKREHSAGRWRGIYCPFWTYDARTRSRYFGMAGYHYFVTVPQTRVVNGRSETVMVQEMRTRWEPRSGELAMDFDDVLVRAVSFTEKAAAPENFNMAGLKAYQAEYLSGYLVKRYEMGLKDGFTQARTIMNHRIRDGIRAQAGGDEWMLQSMDTDVSGASYKQVLLPLWGNHYTYRGKPFDVWVNGQNGSVTGKAPVSAWKVLLCALCVAAFLFGIWFFFLQEEGPIDYDAPSAYEYNIEQAPSEPLPYHNYYN